MAKQSITNISPGVRTVTVAYGKDPEGKPIPQPVALIPGETADLDVFNPDDAVFQGMVKAGELVVGPEGSKPQTPEDKAAMEKAEAAKREGDARKAGYEEGFAKGLEAGKAAAATEAASMAQAAKDAAAAKPPAPKT